MGQASTASKIVWPAFGLLLVGAVFYLWRTGGDWTQPLLTMGVFGIGFSALALTLTRGAEPPETPVARPGLELGVLLVFLAVYAAAFLGPGLSAIKAAFPPGPNQEIAVLAAKLAVHVAIPAALLAALGARILPLFDPGLSGRRFWRTLLVLGICFSVLMTFVTDARQDIAALNAPPSVFLWAVPAGFVWFALEAGLSEEFLYRALLQSRLAAWLRSPAAAIPVTSVLFALAHWPGIYLRGAEGTQGYSTDPWQVAAFVIAALTPVSLLFGWLWMRTRSLLLVVVLHTLVDLPQLLAEFIGIWR